MAHEHPVDREQVLALVQRLGGRRVLTDPVMLEDDALVRGSVRDIRELVTDCMAALAEDSPAIPPLSRLRVRINTYLTTVDNLPDSLGKWEKVRLELVELRGAFRHELTELCQRYELQSACELADRTAQELEWGFPGPGRLMTVRPPPERERFNPDDSGRPTGTARFVRPMRRWFGRDKPRVADLLAVGLVTTVIGGAIVVVILGSSGGESSRSSSAAAPTAIPAPPPKNVRTYAETPGGTVHTWTDYTTAAGSPGPLIPAHMTVRIACKVIGFKVPSGDTWWYRIESGPWDGGYYASADPFYNNGRKTGPLPGSPFVDRRVPDC